MIGRPLKKEEWKPPVPPKTQPYVGVKIPGAGEVARRAPLRPLLYGPIVKPNPFEDVGRETGEGKQGCSLELCPIWVLREGGKKEKEGEATMMTEEDKDKELPKNEKPKCDFKKKQKIEISKKDETPTQESSEQETSYESSNSSSQEKKKKKQKKEDQEEASKQNKKVKKNKKKGKTMWLHIGGKRVKASVE